MEMFGCLFFDDNPTPRRICFRAAAKPQQQRRKKQRAAQATVYIDTAMRPDRHEDIVYPQMQTTKWSEFQSGLL